MKEDKLEEILYKFSNYWRDAREEITGLRLERLNPDEAKAAIQALIDTRVREELEATYSMWHEEGGRKIGQYIKNRLDELKEGKQNG